MGLLQHADGLPGKDRAVALALTPVFVPIWAVGWAWNHTVNPVVDWIAQKWVA